MTQQLTSPTIKGIGIDAIEIARFAHWHTYSDKKLSRIFSDQEIAYCKACPAKSAERFTARFAAREALYKALCQAYPAHRWAFLTLCKAVMITKGFQGQPELTINWKKLTHKPAQLPTDSGTKNFCGNMLSDKNPHILLSITHTDTLAMVWVTLESLSMQKYV